MGTLGELESALASAAEQLDQAARMVKDLELNSELNIRKIGELIVEISLLRQHIYLRDPSLKPGYLSSD